MRQAVLLQGKAHTEVTAIDTPKNKVYTLWHQVDEMPSIILGCPGVTAICLVFCQRLGLPFTCHATACAASVQGKHRSLSHATYDIIFAPYYYCRNHVLDNTDSIYADMELQLS